MIDQVVACTTDAAQQLRPLQQSAVGSVLVAIKFVVAAGDAGSQRFPFSPALCLFHFQRRMFLIFQIAAF